MATWVTISAAQFVTEGFNASERTQIQNAAGGDDGLADILAAAIAEWRGVIEAAGQSLDELDTTTIPPSCRRYIIAQVRWQLLVKFPSLKTLQTEERKLEADKAEEVLRAIAEGDRAVESPIEEDTGVGGDYGSETKIQMRTSRTPQE